MSTKTRSEVRFIIVPPHFLSWSLTSTSICQLNTTPLYGGIAPSPSVEYCCRGQWDSHVVVGGQPRDRRWDSVAVIVDGIVVVSGGVASSWRWDNVAGSELLG